MEKDKKYLDYAGFKSYHAQFVKDILERKYDPQVFFEDKSELFNPERWNRDMEENILGLKNGIIVVVENQFWRLVNAEQFKRILFETFDDRSNKAQRVPVDGDVTVFEVIGSTVNYEVDKETHTLKLNK